MLLKNSALADAATKYAGRVSRALSKSTLMVKAKFKNSDDFVARKVSPPTRSGAQAPREVRTTCNRARSVKSTLIAVTVGISKRDCERLRLSGTQTDFGSEAIGAAASLHWAPLQ
jgi:hypothetical protein